MSGLLHKISGQFPSFPLEWRERAGGEIYRRFQAMRVRQLKGKIKTYNADRPIEYLEVNHGKPERIIFLPGFADTKENFYNCAQFLVSKYDLIALDLPGFGNSFCEWESTYNLENYRIWLTEFIEHTGWSDFHLIGNSLGGSVAIELALSMPDRIKSLTLADAGGIVFKDQTSIYQEFVEGRVIFRMDTPQRFQYFLNRVFVKQPIIPPLVWDHLYRQYSSKGDWFVKLLSDMIENIKSFDDPRVEDVVLNAKIKDIKVPTLIVWGEEDTFFPVSTAPFMQAQIEGSELCIIPNCGHGPQVEAPYKFAKIVRNFVSRRN